MRLRPSAARAIALSAAVVCLAALSSASISAEQMQPRTSAAFDRYVKASEANMAGTLRSGPFLHVDALPATERGAVFAKLKRGEVEISRQKTLDNGQPIPVPDGLIHHWIGTIFIPGADMARTLALLQDYNNHYKYYAPDVQQSKLLSRDGNNFKIFFRLQQKKIVTVTLDANYDVTYMPLTANSTASYSRSTRIAQVENAGKPDEHEDPPDDGGGYLWRLNSYWRILERDGGVYIQLEAISLTRDIPTGLGWLVGPFVSSVPKESLQFTLQRTRDALARPGCCGK